MRSRWSAPEGERRDEGGVLAVIAAIVLLAGQRSQPRAEARRA